MQLIPTRMLALILSSFFLLSMMALVACSDSTVNTTIPQRPNDVARPTIEEQIREFAKSLNQANADYMAAQALAVHGLTGRGKTLTVDKSHALTSALMNSEVVQQTLIAVCTQSTEYMQTTGEKVLYLDLHTGWATFGYYYEAYLDLDKNIEEMIFKLSPVKGIPGNAYDDSLAWMAGSIAADMEIKQSSVSTDMITYNVNIRFWDRFDFSTGSGDDFKDLISGLGELFFNEFDWEATVSFQFTTPTNITRIQNK